MGREVRYKDKFGWYVDKDIRHTNTPQATPICFILKLALGKFSTSHRSCGPQIWRLGWVFN